MAQRTKRGSARYSELPRHPVLGFCIRFYKTFEGILFKCFEVLHLYRPRKWILAIPSLATRKFAVFQALVYNGTRQEVLSFKPHRWFYRLFRGLPDVELFERVRFHLDIRGADLDSVDGSTETRGFVYLQVPWKAPRRLPVSISPTVSPAGIETLLGTLSLGRYEVIPAPMFFLTKETRWVLISDIDDTIKDSRIRETTGLKSILKGIFRGHYYTYQAIPGMAALYHRLAAKGVLVVYVTSTPFQLGSFLLKFLRDAGFPEGPVFMRWLGYNQYSHKIRSLMRIVSQEPNTRFLLIGDSGEHDLAIYRRICGSRDFGHRVVRVMIRHLAGTPLPDKLEARERFYSTVDELENELRDYDS